MDKIVALVAALAAPVLTFLIDEKLLSALQATDIGAILVAAIAAYHVNNDAARASLAVTKPADPPVVSAIPPLP